ncbi:serine/threonine kinase [Aureococcus anophagefferens]|nr:serine/threonine kinase [Aureococcus anophagefferens]
MAEERVLDVREIATLVTTLYADRLPASSSSSGVPAVRSSTGVSESSEEHGVVLIRDSSLKSDEAWTERGCSFGSGASGSTSADGRRPGGPRHRCVAPGGGDRPTSLGGSVHYLSPEVVRREPYGTPVDVWGLGVALYALLTGRLPFVGAATAALFDDIERGDVDFETPEMRRVSPGGRAAVARMLARDPGDRPSARMLLDGEPWLADDAATAVLDENIPQLRAFLSWRATDAPTPRAPPTPAPSPLRSASPAPVETNVPDNVD